MSGSLRILRHGEIALTGQVSRGSSIYDADLLFSQGEYDANSYTLTWEGRPEGETLGAEVTPSSMTASVACASNVCTLTLSGMRAGSYTDLRLTTGTTEKNFRLRSASVCEARRDRYGS